GPADQIVEMLQPERREQACEQGGALAPPVLGPRRRFERPAAEPVAATFIAQLPAVSPGAMQAALRVARVGDRAGAGVHDDAGPARPLAAPTRAPPAPGPGPPPPRRPRPGPPEARARPAPPRGARSPRGSPPTPSRCPASSRRRARRRDPASVRPRAR